MSTFAGLALLVLAGCGLPSPAPILESPVLPANFSAANSYSFEFTNPPQTVKAQVAGFELFYKFYDESNNPTGYLNDVSQMSKDFSSTTPPTNIINYLQSTLQYRRVVQSSVSGYSDYGNTDLSPLQLSELQSVPLINVPAADLNTSFAVTIDFQAAANPTQSQASQTDVFPTVSSSVLSQSFGIARYLPDPNNPGQYFLRGFGPQDFYATDADLPSTVALQGSGSSPNLVLGMIAVAYAQNVLVSPVQVSYSVPTGLTSIPYAPVTLH